MSDGRRVHQAGAGSTSMTGRNGIRPPPPISAITGSTTGWPIPPSRPGPMSGAPWTAGRPGWRRSTTRPVGGAPGRRRDDGGQRGAAGVRARRASRAHLEPAPGQSGQGHLPAAGQGFRAAARAAGLGGRAGWRPGPGQLGGGSQAARADAQGAPGDRHRAVRGHDRADQRRDRHRARGGAAVRGAARPGAPGRPGGPGRAPRVALRAARRAPTVSPIRGSGRSGSRASCRSR